MLSPILKEQVRISFVGVSGTGKSQARRVAQHALLTHGKSSGDFMRSIVLAKYEVDLDRFQGHITNDDDMAVDTLAWEWLLRHGARVIDGRTPSLFLTRMKKEGLISANSTLRVSVSCGPKERALRAWPKYILKPGFENITLEKVMELQKQRDDADEVRLAENLFHEYGNVDKEVLYGPTTNDHFIDTELMNPEEAFLSILCKLIEMGSLELKYKDVVMNRARSKIDQLMSK